MRKFLTAILILSAVFPLRAQQSPYDAFAPAENLYPVLEKGCLDTIFTDTLLLVVEYEGQPYILAEFQTNPQGYVRWLTVDPLVDKYLNISPYAYCNNNPLKYIDPEGRDTVDISYNSKTNHWDISNPIIAKGNDVFRVTGKDGQQSMFTFSEGKYGSRVNCLNIEDSGQGVEGTMLGVYHISGSSQGGTGFYVVPGGEASNKKGSGRRIEDGNYPLTVPGKDCLWQFPGVGGAVVNRGIRFHYGSGNPRSWTEGCFILFTEYSVQQGGKLSISEYNSQTAAINFAHLMGGVGVSRGNFKGRLGVSDYPLSIQDRLILQTRK